MSNYQPTRLYHLYSLANSSDQEINAVFHHINLYFYDLIMSSTLPDQVIRKLFQKLLTSQSSQNHINNEVIHGIISLKCPKIVRSSKYNKNKLYLQAIYHGDMDIIVKLIHRK